MAMPELTEEQRAELPRNVITRALGMQDHVVVDLMSDDPQVGDVYLLCSDGLSGMISDEQILSVVSSSEDSSEICRRLIAKANENGGEDNITALIIRFAESTSDTIVDEPTELAPTLLPPPSDDRRDLDRDDERALEALSTPRTPAIAPHDD
jgi:protein phosphatase